MKSLFCWLICMTFSVCSLKGQIYTEVNDQLGVHHYYGADVYGAGVSFHDFDLDGWDDLSFTSQEGDSLVFFKNVGGSFQRVWFSGAGIHHTGHAKQILWCDYDNDGDKDLLVTSRGFGNFLYVNFGDFFMVPYQIPAPNGLTSAPTYGAAFGDYDSDGHLDLFICNRAIGLSAPNQLFRNTGDGLFTDVTSSYFFNDSLALTFDAAFIDINNDRLPDIYTAEDRWFVNQIYKNEGNGVVHDNCDECGAEIVIDAMSVCPGDFDNDGDLDIYVSNTEDGNALLRNNGDETFTDVGITSGVGYFRVAWGATFFDFDNDKDLDLYVSGSSNGETMTNEMYENQGNSFFSIPSAGFVGDSTRSFGHAIGDINNDGYYDIAVLNIDPDSSQLWQSSGGSNNWIKIDLEGTVSNREGIGTWIEVWCGGQKQVKYTTCGVGYLAQNSDYEIFGLGLSNTIDSINIFWQSGIIDQFQNIAVNQKMEIIEGSSLSTSVNSVNDDAVTIYPNPFFEKVSIEGLEDSITACRIFDDSGKLVASFSLKKSLQHELDLSLLSKGIYLIELTTGSKLIGRRIVKK
ncbi:MAG: FG-GAP-like repeat-containing protein [Bacteroidota bacterium]